MTREDILKEHNEKLLNQVLKLQKEVYLLKLKIKELEIKRINNA